MGISVMDNLDRYHELVAQLALSPDQARALDNYLIGVLAAVVDEQVFADAVGAAIDLVRGPA